jgi:hypothetical protein
MIFQPLSHDHMILLIDGAKQIIISGLQLMILN